MNPLTTARQAIQSEIAFLVREQKRLGGILDQLGGTSTAPAVSGKKRGRKSAAEKAATAEAILAKAMAEIEAAGKAGVKAIRLASVLKKSGHSKVAKDVLLGSGTVKMVGKGGGSTYVFKG